MIVPSDRLFLPPPDLDWVGDTPRSRAYSDKYFDLDNAIAESRRTFLDGIALDDLLKKRDRLVIGETGFGAGLNFLALLERRRMLGLGCRLVFLSTEAFPLARAQLHRALSPFRATLADAAALVEKWPPAYPGLHRISFDGGRVTLLLALGDALSMLRRIEALVDGWFLDGFAPSRNPQMWSEPLFHELARLSRPGARLATFTAASKVRRGLEAAGFRVGTQPGFGGKRERITADFQGARRTSRQERPWFARRAPANGPVAVIGGGIAAATMVAALRDAGVTPTLIGDTPASPLPAALLAPRPDLGAGAPARLATLAMRHAWGFYEALPDAINAAQQGVLTLLPDPASRARAEKLIASLNWPDTDLRWCDAQAASRQAGVTLDTPALFWPRAPILHPRRVIGQLIGQTPRIAAVVHGLKRQGDGWHILAQNGQVIFEAAHVVIAAGPSSAALLGAHQPDLIARRGQVTLLKAADMPGRALAGDGFLTPSLGLEGGPARLLGSSFGPFAGPPSAPVPVLKADRQTNLGRFRALDLAADVLGDWAGIRMTTADHLPLAGPVQTPDALRTHFGKAALDARHRALPSPLDHDGLWIFSGLGARGFQLAPLLAQMVAAEISGQPSPVERAQREAAHPARFVIRRLIRGEN